MKKVSIALATIALLVSGVAPATAATFTWSSQPLTNLNPNGAVIHGGITNFPTKSGLYIQQCETPATVGARPTNCADLGWVSSSGTPGTINPKGDISFTLKTLQNTKTGVLDCSKVTCGLFFRLDHLAANDLSEDTFISISFAEVGTTSVLLATDAISLTLNGKALTKNVPVNLGYRANAKLVATSTSGLPVVLTSATADCSYQNGQLVALKGSGVCAINAATAGNDKYEAARANFPFMLIEGVQKLTLKPTVLKLGKFKVLTAQSNFGSDITYKSNSKNCVVEVNVVEAKRKGVCTITATAPARAGMWGALKVSAKMTVK